MKMVKSLLLVSAAGLVAASGAQAADLPVKAKPVEYVKVCSLYGAGFYYIPGTDICMKIGGYVRYQVNYGGTGNNITVGAFAGVEGLNNRIGSHDFAQRVRAIATFDTRQQTAYGTLRTYLLMGYTQDTNANNGAPVPAGALTPVYNTRAFIQIAGFTFGKATSFFDFVSTAAVAYAAGATHSPDTGDAGQIVGAYTAQFGNGVSATVAIEQSRRLNTIYLPNNTTATFFSAAFSAADNQGNSVVATSGLPDFVGNIRVDQAWGSALVAVAAHNVNAAYYGQGPVGSTIAENNGHPGDKWGWAATAGLRLNAPMIAPGDFFQIGFVYSQGASRYASNTPGGGFQNSWQGNEFAFGQYTDATFGGTAAGGTVFDLAGNAINLTTAWSVFASYEHFWTPSLKTSLYGSYVSVSYNANAKLGYCVLVQTATIGGGNLGCTPDFASWNVGSRSQWNVTNAFYVGLDVIYQKLESASIGRTVAGGPMFITSANLPAGKTGNFFNNADLDAVNIVWRAHRDIVP